MTPDDDARLDALLKQALEPEVNAVERIVRGAIEQQPSRAPARPRWAVAGASAAAALALVLVAGWLATPAGRNDPPPSRQLSGQHGDDGARSAPVRLRISGDDGTITVSTSEGTRWIAVSIDPSRLPVPDTLPDTEPATPTPDPDGV